jgi:hypothetical protein
LAKSTKVKSDGTTFKHYGRKYINCRLEDVPRTFLFRGSEHVVVNLQYPFNFVALFLDVRYNLVSMVLTNLSTHFTGAVIVGDAVLKVCDLAPFHATPITKFSPEIFIYRASI